MPRPEDPQASPSPRRRRRRRRFLLYAVLPFCLLVLALTAAVLFRNPLIRALIPRFLGPKLGLRLRVEEVSLSLGGHLVIRGVAGDEPADWTPLRKLRAEEIVARVSFPALLRHGLEGLESVYLRVSALELDLDRPGLPPRPPIAGPPREPLGSIAALPWPRRLPSLDLELEAFELRSGGNLALARGISLGADTGPGGSVLRLASRLEWSLAGRWGSEEAAISFVYDRGMVSDLKVVVDGAAVMSGGRLDLPHLEGDAELRIGNGGGKLSVAGSGAGMVEADLTLEAVPLERILEPAIIDESPVFGELSLHASARFSIRRPLDGEASLSLSLKPARWGELPLNQLELEARLDRRSLEVGKLEARGREVLIVGDGLRASLETFEPEKFLSSVSGSLLVDVEDVSKLVAPLPRFQEIVPLLAEASLEAHLACKDIGLNAERVILASPLFEVDLEGVRFQLEPGAVPESGLSGSGSLSVMDLSRLGPLLPGSAPALGGGLEVTFAARGTLGGLDARASFQGESLEAAGVPLGALSGMVAVDGQAVEIEQLSLDGDGTEPLHLALAARVLIPDGFIENGSLVCEGSGLSVRARALEPFSRRLPSGAFSLVASARGPLAWPDLSIRARAEEAGAGGGPTLAIQASKTGDEFLADIDGLTLEGVALSAGLRGTVREGLASGEVTIERLSLARDGETWVSEGASRVHFDGEGRLLVDPPLLVAGERGRILLGLRPAEEAGNRLDAIIDAQFPGRLAIPSGAGTLEACGIRAGTRAVLEECWLIPGRVPLPLSLSARFSAAEVSSERGTILGRIEGLNAAFDLALPAPGAEASLAVRIPRVRITAPGEPDFGEPIEGEFQFEARWDGREVRIETLQGTLADAKLSGGGSVEFAHDLRKVIEGEESGVPGRIDLLAALEARDLSSLKKLAPALRRFDGSLRLEGTVSGSGGSPSADAALVLKDVEVRYGDAPPLSSLNARILFEGTTARVDSFEGEVGGAPVRAAGLISDLYGTPEFNLRLTGTNVLLLRNDRARLRADTSLRVSGEMRALTLDGSLRITDGRVFQQIPLLEFLANLTRKVGGLAARKMTERKGPAVAKKASGLKLFSLREASIKDFRFAVDVNAVEPIEIRSNVFHGKVRPEVKLEGTGEVPYLVGTVYLDDFILSLPATNVRIDAGSIHFDEKNPLVPELNMTGSTRMMSYDITVSITGPLNEPTVLFSSIPPLPSDKLILLVATGQAPAAEGVESDQRALFTVAKYFGVDLLRRFFGSEDISSNESILDRFDFEMGRDLSRSGRETWEARFRMKRDLLTRSDALYLTGEQDQWEHYNLGLRIVFRGGGA